MYLHFIKRIQEITQMWSTVNDSSVLPHVLLNVFFSFFLNSRADQTKLNFNEYFE